MSGILPDIFWASIVRWNLEYLQGALFMLELGKSPKIQYAIIVILQI